MENQTREAPSPGRGSSVCVRSRCRCFGLFHSSTSLV